MELLRGCHIAKFYRTPQFQQLDAEWQRRLKEDGFKDAESPDRVYLKEWHSVYFQIRNTEATFESKTRYFELAAQFLWTHKFEKKSHRSIWMYHCEGYSLREIAVLMRKHKVLVYKDKVNLIIHRLRDIMLKENQNDDDE